jgi:hypothetical protein
MEINDFRLLKGSSRNHVFEWEFTQYNYTIRLVSETPGILKVWILYNNGIISERVYSSGIEMLVSFGVYVLEARLILDNPPLIHNSIIGNMNTMLWALIDVGR